MKKLGVRLVSIIGMLLALLMSVGRTPCVAAPRDADLGGRNILENGGFEIGEDAPQSWKRSWRRTLPGMTSAEFTWDSDVARTDKRSVRIHHTAENYAGQFAYWTADLQGVMPNTWYELSGYVKLDAVGGGGVYLTLGKSVSLPQLGTSDWLLVKVVTKTPPENPELNVSVQGRRFFGTAWFDDLAVVELRGRPADFPGTPPKRPDEVVGVWMHCSTRWGVRPFPTYPQREAPGAKFDPDTFRRDLEQFFATMNRLGLTDLYGIPRDAKWYKEKWGVEFPADRLYLKECERHGIRAFAEIVGFRAPKASGDAYACRDQNGQVVRGLCLTRPQVREYTFQVSALPCIERIRRYRSEGFKVAGICTDGIRWATTRPCWCELCREEYAKVKGRMTLEQFRCEQVTRYVRRVRAELNKMADNLMLVGAVKAGRNCLRFGQDVPRWLREGTYDYIMPMAYGGPSTWVMTIDFLTKEAGVDPKKIVMLTALYRVGPEPTVTQIALAKARGILGYSFFGWRFQYYTHPNIEHVEQRWTQLLVEAINARGRHPRPEPRR